MSLFGGSDERALRKWPALLLPADPGQDRVLTAVHGYSPMAKAKGDRIIVYGHVVLHGPVTITPELAGKAQLPTGSTAAYYAGVMDPKDTTQRKESGRLLRGLAVRLGGSVHPADVCAELALLTSVYSRQDLPADQIISLLAPWAPGLAVSQPDDRGYALEGQQAPFYVAYWAPKLWKAFGLAGEQPRALGDLAASDLHHWDLHCRVAAVDAPAGLVQLAGEAALALGHAVNGMAIDTYGFAFSRADELLPR
jgi:hypothetical protein